jgi:hypothetical protein
LAIGKNLNELTSQNEGSADFQTQMAWACSRHETCNKRIKIFSCTSHHFQHNVSFYQDFFDTVLALTQLNIQNCDKLFDIEFPNEVEDELSSDDSSDIDQSIDDDSSSYDSSSEDFIVSDVLSSSNEDDENDYDDVGEDDEEGSDEDDKYDDDKDESDNDDNEDDNEDDKDGDDDDEINDEEDYNPNYDEGKGYYSMMDDEDADDGSFFLIDYHITNNQSSNKTATTLHCY